MAKDYLGHFYLEYRNAVFTMVFLALENLAVDASLVLLPVIVRDFGRIEFLALVQQHREAKCAITHEI